MAALYARCPSCGDNGDVTHIAACTRVALANKWRAAVPDAVREVLAAVRTQVGRRGAVDITALGDMARNRWGV
jgi:hypothetical protein